MPPSSIPPDYAGWWRIIETSAWAAKHLDLLGPALISLGDEYGDRLRLLAILAHVNARFTRNGISFTWQGASEYDPISGTGRARLGKDGRLKGKIAITGGDESTFVAERSAAPSESISDPPSYRDKWRRRW
jgi:hypothetical protein